jgi:hypothetical protein
VPGTCQVWGYRTKLRGTCGLQQPADVRLAGLQVEAVRGELEGHMLRGGRHLRSSGKSDAAGSVP